MRRLLVILTLGLSWGLAGSAAAQPKNASSGVDVKKLLGTVGSRCLEAKNAAELDALQAQLSAATQSSSSRAEGRGEDRARLQAALHFVGEWRNYLSATAAGNKSEAHQIAWDLCKRDDWVGLVPRSKVLAKAYEFFRFYFVEYPTDTLAALDVAIAQNEKLDRLIDRDPKRNEKLQSFLTLRSVRDDPEKRGPIRIEEACRLRGDESIEIGRFKLLILPLAIPGYLDLPAEYHLKPEEGEAALAYLDRLGAMADAKGDLVTLWRTLTYSLFLQADRPVWLMEKKQALDYCLDGRKKESRGEWVAAVVAYRSALSYHGTKGTQAFAGERLRSLAASNPEEYQAGLFQAERPNEYAGRLPNDPRSQGMRPPIPGDPSREEMAWKKY